MDQPLHHENLAHNETTDQGHYLSQGGENEKLATATQPCKNRL